MEKLLMILLLPIIPMTVAVFVIKYRERHKAKQKARQKLEQQYAIQIEWEEDVQRRHEIRK